MHGHLDREACPAQTAKHGVVEANVRRPRPHLRLHQADRPAVTRQRFAGRDRAPAHRRPPIASDQRQLDLAEDDVDDAVEDVRLVGDVVVERHRLNAELLCELAHRQRLKARLVREGDRRT